MKLFTGLTLGSVLIAGVACSEPAGSNGAAASDPDTQSTQTVQLDEPEGTFNLSLPGSIDDADTSSGLNLSFGEPTNNNLLTGDEGFGDADFGSVPEVDIAVGAEPDLAPEIDDDLIRLPSND